MSCISYVCACGRARLDAKTRAEMLAAEEHIEHGNGADAGEDGDAADSGDEEDKEAALANQKETLAFLSDYMPLMAVIYL